MKCGARVRNFRLWYMLFGIWRTTHIKSHHRSHMYALHMRKLFKAQHKDLSWSFLSAAFCLSIDFEWDESIFLLRLFSLISLSSLVGLLPVKCNTQSTHTRIGSNTNRHIQLTNWLEKVSIVTSFENELKMCIVRADGPDDISIQQQQKINRNNKNGAEWRTTMGSETAEKKIIKRARHKKNERLMRYQTNYNF